MEYGILVIKPDGMEKKTYGLIEKLLYEESLSLVESYDRTFEYNEAKKIFNTNAFVNDDYYKYLSSGVMKIALLKGVNAISKLRNIKYHIRRIYDCEKQMKNLLHSSDSGNEYKIQLQYLFPNLNYDNFSLYSDMHIPIENFLHTSNPIYKLETNGVIVDQKNLSKSIINCILPKRGFVGIRREFMIKDKKIPLICYLKTSTDWYRRALILKRAETLQHFLAYTSLIKGICIVDYLPYDFYTREFVYSIKEAHIQGMKIFDTRYTLDQIENIKYLVQYKYKMLYTGGSNVNYNSKLTVDEETYIRFLNAFIY